MLTHLQASFDERLFSEWIWRFELKDYAPPAARGIPIREDPGTVGEGVVAKQDMQTAEGSGAAEHSNGKGPEEDQKRPQFELPYSRFSRGESVVILKTLADGEVPQDLVRA